MKRLLILLAISVQINISAQIRNLRVDDGCLAHNSAIIDSVFLNVFDEDTISNWLINKKSVIIICTIDCRGSLVSMDRFIGRNQPAIGEQSITEIAKYIQENDILFSDCRIDEPHVGYERFNQIWLNSNPLKTSFHINVAFPGPVSVFYGKKSMSMEPIELFKEFIKQNITPTMRELLMRDKCIVYMGDGGIILGETPESLLSAKLISDCTTSVHYDSDFFDAYDELSANISAGLNTVSDYRFDRVLYRMEKGINPSCVDYDYFEEHIDSPEFLKSRFHLKDDGTESISRMMEILSSLYTEKYGCTDYFNQQCLKRIAEIE